MVGEGMSELEEVERRLAEIGRSLPSERGGAVAGGPADEGRLRSLGLVLTEACNLRCRYCYQNRKRARSMSWEVLRASLDLLLDSGNPRLNVAFFGGEPLLELELIRRAVEYAEARRPPGSCLAFEVSTNGTLLDREAVQLLARHRIRTEISFDGVRQAQDVRASGTFELLDGVLTGLGESEPEFYRDLVGVRLTVGSHNLRHLADSVAYFIDRGVGSISMSTLMTHDRGWRGPMIEELDRQFERISNASLDHYRRTGEVPVTALRVGSRRRTEHGGVPMCGVRCADRMAVDVDGDATPCVAFSEKNQELPSGFLVESLRGLGLGSVFDGGIEERLRGFRAALARVDLFWNKQDKRSSYGRCADCAFLHSCHVCPVSIGHIPGNTDPDRVPDSACAFNMVADAHAVGFLEDSEQAAG